MKHFIKIKIGKRNWEVRFVPKDTLDNSYGTCWSLKRTIDIEDNLDYEETKIILGHELTHAFLTQFGQGYNNAIDREYIAEFIGWNIDEIMSIRNQVLKERFKEKNDE